MINNIETELQLESEEYAKNQLKGTADKVSEFVCINDFIAGVNSKYVKKKIIQAQIDLLKQFYYGEGLKDDDILRFYTELKETAICELQNELKEIKNNE